MRSATSERPVRDPERSCPCGSGATFGGCCGPLLDDARAASTPEQLMRSRFTAYAVGDVEHLLRTWHPSTRPAREVFVASLAGDLRWTRLVIHAAERGRPGDETGRVEFTAIARDAAGTKRRLREDSSFVRERGRWLYVDGEISPT